jgi:hypothetical protein
MKGNGNTMERQSNIGGRIGSALSNIGHRYKRGHPHHPRKPGSKTAAAVFKRRSKKLLRKLTDERDGELSVTQTIHAQNAADLGAAIMELKDKKKAGEFVDPAVITNLVNAQRRSLDALDE